MNNVLLEKYAELIVKTGINIQKNQTLVITSPVECAEFTRLVAKSAYIEGAKDVVINWKDELLSKIRYTYAPDEVFDEVQDWQKEFFINYSRIGAGFISIAASDPEVMQGVDTVKIVRVQKASNTALKEYRERLMSNKNPWCVVSIPTVAWAKKVFPQLGEDEAMEKLWNEIIKTVRVDLEDPVEQWKNHVHALKNKMNKLNNYNFKLLKYKNALGTDLTIELPEGHLWLGGSDLTAEGVEFVANMPTEEVFTLPKKNGVNGKVVSSMPLNHNGILIENLSLTFKEGKIVDFTASKGLESLKSLIETDEGSHYLGEVALVPFDSPISKSNILFYNTLFDENASCHLAIGKAYPVCIKDSETLTEGQLTALGMNDSLVHEDFMIGTEDLNIIGITYDNKEIQIFEKGKFSI